jgi:hypothetical protein
MSSYKDSFIEKLTSDISEHYVNSIHQYLQKKDINISKEKLAKAMSLPCPGNKTTSTANRGDKRQCQYKFIRPPRAGSLCDQNGTKEFNGKLYCSRHHRQMVENENKKGKGNTKGNAKGKSNGSTKNKREALTLFKDGNKFYFISGTHYVFYKETPQTKSYVYFRVEMDKKKNINFRQITKKEHKNLDEDIGKDLSKKSGNDRDKGDEKIFSKLEKLAKNDEFSNRAKRDIYKKFGEKFPDSSSSDSSSDSDSSDSDKGKGGKGKKATNKKYDSSSDSDSSDSDKGKGKTNTKDKKSDSGSESDTNKKGKDGDSESSDSDKEKKPIVTKNSKDIKGKKSTVKKDSKDKNIKIKEDTKDDEEKDKEITGSKGNLDKAMDEGELSSDDDNKDKPSNDKIPENIKIDE